MTFPQIILLNGASSSGKSTLCRELRTALPQPYLYLSSDLLVEGGMLPKVNRIQHDTPWSWNTIRPHFFEGFHRSIRAFAEAGNCLLIEHIVEKKEWLEELVLLLQPFSVFYIGVFCPLEELEKREQQRGDRFIGEGRSHLEDGIHDWSGYDLVVDTYQHTARENTENILIALEKAQKSQSEFHILYSKFYINQKGKNC